jgi:hypothetical protein
MSLRDLVPPSARRTLNRARSVLRVQVARARVWNWELVCLAPIGQAPYRILYVGTTQRRQLIREVLGLELTAEDGVACRGTGASLRLPGFAAPLPLAVSDDTAILSEMPLRGALRIPWSIHAVVPLGRSIDEVVASYDGELRRRLRKRAEYRLRPVIDEADVLEISRTMIEPYATARHGQDAQQIPPEAVLKMARGAGGARLDVMLRGEEAVACHLGFPFARGGKRYWETIRFGYPEAVFSDPKRLRDVNSMNTFLMLVWSSENGFDYYNMGQSPAHPDSGLLQWKRRRGGAAHVLHNDGYFSMRLPRRGAAKFLWDAPLFAAERGTLTLRLGLPLGPSDDDAARRYRELGYGGLSKVYLHCARPPGEALLENLRGLFARQAMPTAVETLVAS